MSQETQSAQQSVQNDLNQNQNLNTEATPNSPPGGLSLNSTVTPVVPVVVQPPVISNNTNNSTTSNSTTNNNGASGRNEKGELIQRPTHSNAGDAKVNADAGDAKGSAEDAAQKRRKDFFKKQPLPFKNLTLEDIFFNNFNVIANAVEKDLGLLSDVFSKRKQDKDSPRKQDKDSPIAKLLASSSFREKIANKLTFKCLSIDINIQNIRSAKILEIIILTAKPTFDQIRPASEHSDEMKQFRRLRGEIIASLVKTFITTLKIQQEIYSNKFVEQLAEMLGKIQKEAEASRDERRDRRNVSNLPFDVCADVLSHDNRDETRYGDALAYDYERQMGSSSRLGSSGRHSASSSRSHAGFGHNSASLWDDEESSFERDNNRDVLVVDTFGRDRATLRDRNSHQRVVMGRSMRWDKNN